MPHVREAKRNELQHYKNLLAIRTDDKGKPKKGYADNVTLLRTLIARTEKEIATPEAPEAVQPA